MKCSRPSFLKSTRTNRLVMESLENRALLAANGLTHAASSTLYGDANLDGEFNSRDLVEVFQAGKYETPQAADWSEGDWNLDGQFDSQDLIAALQRGTYSLSAAAAEIAIPFKGSIEAIERNVDFQFPIGFQEGSGSGNATHLGRFEMTFEFAVNVLSFYGVGSYHFTAANGDSIFTRVEGTGTVPDPFSHIVETHTITGGTGRFTGATGSFTLDRILNSNTGVSSGSVDGTIVIPKG